MTGDEVLATLEEARYDGHYVCITPDGQMLVGDLDAIMQHMHYVAFLKRLPTEGVTKQ